MSRILKAPFITVDNESSIPIDNSLQIPPELLANMQKNYEEEFALQQRMIEQDREDILEVARKQSEQIIENAKQEAKEILLQADIEIQEKSSKIYEESQRNGYTKGYEKGYSETEALKIEAEETLLNAKFERQQLEEQLEPEIINLIIGISQKILTDAFSINPQIISLLIRKGLQNIKDLKDLKISVSEKQYEYVLKNKNEILGIDTNKNNIEIIKDISLDDDDCVIETEFGTIKCGVKEQFNGIKEALQYILN